MNEDFTLFLKSLQAYFFSNANLTQINRVGRWNETRELLLGYIPADVCRRL